jgi:repressor LexA
LRQIHRMAYELLLARIDERLRALGLSERKACMNAGVGVNTIRHIRKRGHAPKATNLAKLAEALGVPPNYFLEAAAAGAEEEKRASSGPIRLASVFVKGDVQAGVWREALEWTPDEWFAVTVPTDERYREVERLGLLVRGTSMDRLYPDGTVVIVVRFGDLARMPHPGERVVVLRRSRNTGDFEATLKEYDRDLLGRHLLWPRSMDPEFQTPFVLGPDGLKVADFEEALPSTVRAGDLPHETGELDVFVSALVIGSYRRE